MTSQSTPRGPVPVATRLACPCCGGPVARVHRRFIDRLLAPLRGVKRRYRCTIVTCGWTTSESVESEPALLRAWNDRSGPDPTGKDSRL